jgi:hypothetical protein
MNSPPNEKPLLGGKGLRELTMELAYHALNLVQAPFGFLFWLIEQRKAHIDVERERRRT